MRCSAFLEAKPEVASAPSEEISNIEHLNILENYNNYLITVQVQVLLIPEVIHSS